MPGAEPQGGSGGTDVPPDQPALSVRSLTKRFGDRVAFSDVSFEARRGEVFGFLGRSRIPRHS